MKRILKFPEFNRRVIIRQSEDASSPREDDNLGLCAFFHRSYNFGDKTTIDCNDYNSFAEMQLSLEKKGAVVLPVYMLDHSGLSLATNSFNDSWDSGQLGLIIAYRDKIKAEYNCKNVTQKIKERVKLVLEAEIETLNQYVQGDIYNFEVQTLKKKKSKDSCCGFYGDEADNGMFDYIDIEGLTIERYTEVFEASEMN